MAVEDHTKLFLSLPARDRVVGRPYVGERLFDLLMVVEDHRQPVARARDRTRLVVRLGPFFRALRRRDGGDDLVEERHGLASIDARMWKGKPATRPRFLRG